MRLLSVDSKQLRNVFSSPNAHHNIKIVSPASPGLDAWLANSMKSPREEVA